MTKSESQLVLGIFLYKRVNLGPAFLFQTIFDTANRYLGINRYTTCFCGGPVSDVFVQGPVSISLSSANQDLDYLLIPPISGFTGEFQASSAESEYLLKVASIGTILASACLGALILSASGLLEARPATTHWKWAPIARQLFPNVLWDESKMVCDLGNIITAGGFLASIDLALHIIGTNSSMALAHEVSRYLLADSTRQKQSIYAQTLISQRFENPQLKDLDTWVNENLHQSLTLEKMADFCSMGKRTFQRTFQKAFGVSPIHFLQVRRIEKTKTLLRDSTLSLDSILERVGISDPAFLRKIFKRELGMTPAEYRKRLCG